MAGLHGQTALSSASRLVAALSDVGSAEQNFYAQKSYAERGTDNLAKWLSVPHVTMFDVVLLLPLIPVLAILISWWLPWERWLFERSPRKIMGPYFLYCALVLWHFHARWWFIALAAVVGAGSLAATIIERGMPWRRDQS
jgi:hypothetical protein